MTDRDRNGREAREHVPGRLHEIFAEPYTAFDNDSVERLLHIHIMLHVLVVRPMRRGHLMLRVIHGWENGGFAPEDLKQAEYPLPDFGAYQSVADLFNDAATRLEAPPSDAGSPLIDALQSCIEAAKAEGKSIKNETLENPARWPELPNGLSVYTVFKIYNRLVYGEDDAYRSSRCTCPDGIREIHEFHLEEAEFAIIIPPGPQHKTENTVIVMHDSQLAPFASLFALSIPLFEN